VKRLKTIRVRFAVWTAGLLLIILLAFGALVYYGMAQGLTSAIDNTLQLNATQAVAGINAENTSLTSLDGFMNNLEGLDISESGFTLRVLDAKGQILQEVGAYKTLPIPYNDFTAALRGQDAFNTLLDPIGGDMMRVYLAPIRQDNQIIGVIQIAHNMAEVNETLETLLTVFLLGVPLLVILTGAGSYFLAAYTLRPIDKITRAARQISAQDLSARLDLPPTDDEVGRLAATFDTMLARLDTAFQRERQFTADASHELRTPLAAMQAILDMIREKRRSPQAYEDALADLAAETHRLRALIEDLLHLAREAPLQPSAFETVNLSELLVAICDSLRPLAEAKDLSLSCNAAEGLTLSGDSDNLIRLFLNLIDNAIKYTARGAIDVSARRQDDLITVAVSDTGAGIAAEHLPRLFDRFYRVDKSRNTDGSGLGLAIARKIAQAHGGAITVGSEPGRGTTFTVTLAAKNIAPQ